MKQAWFHGNMGVFCAVCTEMFEAGRVKSQLTETVTESDNRCVSDAESSLCKNLVAAARGQFRTVVGRRCYATASEVCRTVEA
jgi:hypothetical protein